MTSVFELAEVSVNDAPARITRKRAGTIEIEDGILDLGKLNLAVDAANASPNEDGEIVIAIRLRPE